MKNIRVAILAVCLGTLFSMAALAQTGNTIYGTDAFPKDVGSYDSAFGNSALYSNDGGNYNSAFGLNALRSNTSGGENTAAGATALYTNTTGGSNTAVGWNALFYNTTGGGNTAVGTSALVLNTTSGGNTAVGGSALDETTGGYNTAVGGIALYQNTTGTYNIVVGYSAGVDNPAGASYNIDIGSKGSSSDSHTIRIGTPGTQTSFYAAGVDGVTVSSGVPVYINSSGQLGTVNSSIRLKEDVHDMGDASSAILRLRPVTYRYKQPYADGSKPIDYGLVAEEVAKVYPDLVVKGADGQIQTVQYQKLTPMLLNELQKQHRLVEQMGKTLEQQQAMARQQETIQLLKAQQTETVQLLQKRLAALEAERPSARLEARVAAQ